MARRGENLNTWMAAVRADDLTHLHRFVRGLDADHDAVRNDLTLPYSSGATQAEQDSDGWLVRAQGLSELVADSTATFYSNLDRIEVLDPAKAQGGGRPGKLAAEFRRRGA